MKLLKFNGSTNFIFWRMVALLIVFCVFLLIPHGFTQMLDQNVPGQINIQGRLTDEQGVNLNGKYKITFRIWKNATTKDEVNDMPWEEIYEETQEKGDNRIEVVNGLYQAFLGDIIPIEAEIFDGTVKWLGITIEGEEEMVPRLKLASYGYAYRAEIANQVVADAIKAENVDFNYADSNEEGGSANDSEKLGGHEPDYYLNTSISEQIKQGPLTVNHAGATYALKGYAKDLPGYFEVVDPEEWVQTAAVKGINSGIYGCGGRFHSYGYGGYGLMVTHEPPTVNPWGDDYVWGYGIYSKSTAKYGYGICAEGLGQYGYGLYSYASGNGGTAICASAYGANAYAAKLYGRTQLSGKTYAYDSILADMYTGPNECAVLVENRGSGWGLIAKSHTSNKWAIMCNASNQNDPASAGLVVQGGTAMTGNLLVYGPIKAAVVKTPSYGYRTLFSRESPTCRFIDEGEMQLVNGEVRVNIDLIFKETIETTPNYLVHLTELGDGSDGLYVAERTPDYFIVKEKNNGNSNVAFCWQMTAFRLNHKDLRLEEAEGPPELPDLDELEKREEVPEEKPEEERPEGNREPEPKTE